MSAGSRKSKGGSLLLVILLCVLQWLVTGQERLARSLDGPSRLLASVSRAVWSRRSAGKKRGSRPTFPSTVAVILTEEWAATETLDSLATLVHWSAAAGIQLLQLYEKCGHLKASALGLSSRLNFQKQLYAVQTISHEDELKSGHTTKREAPSLQPGCRMTVTLLSAEDATLPVTTAIKAGGVLRRHEACTVETLTEELSDAAGSQIVQQPQLVWVFGPALTLAGFPPWLVKQSEIHSMGSLSSLREQDIQKGLQRYCQTTQRFGK